MSQPSMSRMTPVERAALASVYAARRWQVLRLAVPGLLIYTLVLVPVSSVALAASTLLQMLLSGALFGVALWATATRRVELAAQLALVGTFLTSVIITINTGPIDGTLQSGTLVALTAFLLPIILAGILASPRVVVVVTGASFAFSALLLAVTPLSANAQATLHLRVNALLVIVPLLAQMGAGFLSFAGTYGFRRMQRDLADVRLAYAREKETEQLREQFIASVNHELRNPIMAVQHYLVMAQTLGSQGKLEEQQRMLQSGTEVAERLTKLVQSILEIRRLHTVTDLDLKPIALAPLAWQAARMLALLSPGNRQLVQVQIPNDLAVLAETEHLQEVLGNLLANAAKYSPPNSPITIAARPLSLREAQVLRPGRLPAEKLGFVEITVRDQGMGIPPDKALIIFEPFVRLSRDEGSPVIGSGLGLAICRANVQAMHGDIWVESAGIPGEGSTFHIVLPRAADQPPPTRRLDGKGAEHGA